MKEKSIIFKIVLGIVIIIVLAIPIFIFSAQANKAKKFEQLIDDIELAAQKWVNKHNPEFLEQSEVVKLGTLKQDNFLDVNLKNPKNNIHYSNESYVVVSKNNGTYSYDVHLIEIPSRETTAGLIVNIIGDKEIQNGISVRYEDLGINISDGVNEIDYSVQYFLKNEEVKAIDSSRPRNYEVVYTALNKKGDIAKIVRTVIVQ